MHSERHFLNARVAVQPGEIGERKGLRLAWLCGCSRLQRALCCWCLGAGSLLNDGMRRERTIHSLRARLSLDLPAIQFCLKLLNALLHGVKLFLNGRRDWLLAIARRWNRGLRPLPVGRDWNWKSTLSRSAGASPSEDVQREIPPSAVRGGRTIGVPSPNLRRQSRKSSGRPPSSETFAAACEHPNRKTPKNTMLKEQTKRKTAFITFSSGGTARAHPCNLIGASCT